MTDVDMRTDRQQSETTAYWYDETTDERDRGRAVLEALRTLDAQAHVAEFLHAMAAAVDEVEHADG